LIYLFDCLLIVRTISHYSINVVVVIDKPLWSWNPRSILLLEELWLQPRDRPVVFRNENVVWMGYYLMLLHQSDIPNIIPRNPERVNELSTGLYQKLNKLVHNNWTLNNHEQLILGRLYEYGLGCEKNLYEAVKWYRESASEGNAVAQNNLALVL